MLPISRPQHRCADYRNIANAIRCAAGRVSCRATRGRRGLRRQARAIIKPSGYLRGVHEWSSARLTCERSWQFSEELVSLKKAPRSFSPIDDRTPYHVFPPPRPKLKKLVKAMPDLYSTPLRRCASRPISPSCQNCCARRRLPDDGGSRPQRRPPSCAAWIAVEIWSC